MNTYYEEPEHIDRFIKCIQKNWRNSVYITCSVCRYRKEKNCDDLLMTFDFSGKPIFITVHDANILFNTIIDKSECAAEISNVKTLCFMNSFIKENTSVKEGCPFLQLIKNR